MCTQQTVMAICKELGLPSGYVDNLLLIPTGDIVVVEAKLWRGLTLKRKASDGRMFNIGFIIADGRLETDYVNWQAQSIGRLDLAHRYQSAMAGLVAGPSVRQTEKPTGWRVAIAGHR
jgi:hypothetical protein